MMVVETQLGPYNQLYKEDYYVVDFVYRDDLRLQVSSWYPVVPAGGGLRQGLRRGLRQGLVCARRLLPVGQPNTQPALETLCSVDTAVYSECGDDYLVQAIVLFLA
eukprot:GFUD01129075.1.p1 GENE.GFUD01129075.1~~GFUD01129075.1.p1  ORF type:complete len:106 (-),score=3.28 GFUD01129075.1:8-325(-)